MLQNCFAKVDAHNRIFKLPHQITTSVQKSIRKAFSGIIYALKIASPPVYFEFLGPPVDIFYLYAPNEDLSH